MNSMKKSDTNIKIAFLLNISFAVIEIFGGILTNSIAIISDSIHDFCDALSIGIAFFLEKKSHKKPDQKYTFGYLRFSLLGAFITSAILLIGSCLVLWQVFPRLLNPVKVNYDGMLILAVLGVIINGAAAFKTAKTDNLNERAVSLHMFEDVLGWAAVLIGSLIIKITKLYIIDSILSIAIAVFILINVAKNIRKIFAVFLEKIPEGTDINKIKTELSGIEGVSEIHHIHIWSMDSENNFITLHSLLNTDASPSSAEQAKSEIKEKLKEMNFVHSTIEIEFSNCGSEICSIANVSE